MTVIPFAKRATEARNVGTVSPASNFVRSAAYAGAHTVLIDLEAPDSVPFAEVIRGEAQTLVPELFA